MPLGVPRAIKSCRIRWNSEAVPASAASERAFSGRLANLNGRSGADWCNATKPTRHSTHQGRSPMQPLDWFGRIRRAL